MPLDTSSNETIARDVCNYIKGADVFHSTHPTTADKWCLGLNAENQKTATQLESFLSHIIKDRTIIAYSNEAASQWCKGKYNVVIVTQYNEDDVKALQKQFHSPVSENDE